MDETKSVAVTKVQIYYNNHKIVAKLKKKHI